MQPTATTGAMTGVEAPGRVGRSVGAQMVQEEEALFSLDEEHFNAGDLTAVDDYGGQPHQMHETDTDGSFISLRISYVWFQSDRNGIVVFRLLMHCIMSTS